MDCPVCEKSKPNERFILNGTDIKTNEVVQFHLPRSIVLKIKEFSEQSERLFGQLPKEKMLTITFDSKTYKINECGAPIHRQ